MSVKSYVYKNRKEINDLQIPNGYIDSISMDTKYRKMKVFIIGKSFDEDLSVITFENVMYFNWNKGSVEKNAILDIYLGNDDIAKEYEYTKPLKEQKNQEKTKFIDVCIQTHEGYINDIICEKMIFMDQH